MAKLLAATEDYCLLKIILAAAACDYPLDIVKGCTDEELSAKDAAAKSLLLETSVGTVAQHIAILRYVADQNPAVELLGASDIDKAQVNQWLEFSWQELEVPVQILLSLTSTEKASSSPPAIAPPATPEETETVKKQAVEDLVANLALLEDHISTRTFMVGERPTAADISLFAVYKTIQEPQLESVVTKGKLLSFEALARWYMTMASQKFVLSVLGASMASFMTAIAAVGVASSAASAAATAAASSSNSTSVSAVSGPVGGGKWDRRRTRVKELLSFEGSKMIGQQATLKGWIRTARSAEKGQMLFVELTDGSTVKGVQLVLSTATTVGAQAVMDAGGAGASISVIGTVMESPAKGQLLEVHVTEATVLGAVYGGEGGSVGGKNYPMAKKAHSMEFLREKAHLRPRSKMFAAAMRVRHAMAFATHKFFNERGFVYVHTPLITAADCEGAGEQFTVTTLLKDDMKPSDVLANKDGKVDFSKDFFGRRCSLTVSGQLNVETHACALSDVYTFGPTFRAENSHTSRHLAEFWMIEPEICFADLRDDMALAEDYVKFCTAYALEQCADDLEYFETGFPMGEKGLRARLQNVLDSDFAVITYTEAVELLQRDIKAKKLKVKDFPKWGDDLGSEHERYITEKVYQRPTIVTDYPKGIKAFYMKMNPDNATVAAMDILVPKIGELIGGSQREDNLEVLQARALESGLAPEDIWWYSDLRRYGTVPHAGFGLGFERLIMFVTGLENIRDVIPFPRVPGHADF